MVLLHSDNWYSRISAAMVLSQLGIPISVEPFLTDLKDPERKKRDGAVRVLTCAAKAGIEIPGEPLFAALRKEPYWCNGIEFVLGHLKASVPEEHLISALNDKNPQVRQGVLKALYNRAVFETIENDEATRSTLSYTKENPVSNERVYRPKTFTSQAFLERLLRMLQDDQEIVRREAVRLLSYLSEWVQIPPEPLIEALPTIDQKWRSDIMIALGNCNAPVPTEPLLKALGEDEERVRQQAAYALVKLGISVSEDLLQLHLQRHITGMRFTALHILMNAKNILTRELLEILLDDESVDIRALAVEALGKSGIQASLALLLKALKDEDSQVRTTAAEALGKLDEPIPIEPLLSALYDSDRHVREEVARTLGKIGERVPLEPLLLALQDEHAFVRAAAADALGELGTRAPLEPLLPMVNDQDAYVRKMVVWALSTQGKSKPIDLLVKALKDENTYVRIRAVEALVASRTDIPVPPILTGVQHAKNSKAPQKAAQGWQQAYDKMLTDLVVAALEEENRSVWKRALKLAIKIGHDVPLEPLLVALDRFGGDEQIALRIVEERFLGEEALLAALSSSHWSVRKAAAHLLGKKAVQRAIPLLIALLEDHEEQSWRVAVSAALALKDLQVPLEPLIASLLKALARKLVENDSASVAQALGQLEAREPLIQALSHRQTFHGNSFSLNGGDVRSAAIQALKHIQGQTITELIIAALGDSEQRVREAAGEALQQRDPEALLSVVPEAIAILQGHAPGNILGSLLQGVIAEAIGNLGYTSPTLVEKLVNLLDWSYWEVQVKAIEALGRLRRNIPDAAIRHLFELWRDPFQPQTIRQAVDQALASILALEGIEDG
jgi:HEAT repeat protein